MGIFYIQTQNNRQLQPEIDIIFSLLNSCIFCSVSVNTIKMTKPEHAAMIENNLCMMARSGQIMGKLSDEDFKGLLSRVSAGASAQKPKTTVTFQRRRAALDSDSDSD